MAKKLIIGSRGSKLAMIQSNWVKSELEKNYPDLTVEIKEIQTQGDKILDVALSKIGDKGLFVKELETELLAETIDLAVHSMKDMQTTLPDGLEIAVTTKREDLRDVVCMSKANIAAGKKSISEINTVGTSSLRRTSQLKRRYPHINFVDLRGNLGTRFKKLNEGQMDAMILAAAGVNRLGEAEFSAQVTECLDPNEILPAVGQGALAIEIASKRSDVKEIISVLNSKNDELIVKGERAFLRNLEGGCQVPIGIYSELNTDQVKYTGMVSSLDGARYLREEISGALRDAEKLGLELSKKLLNAGAKEILERIARD